MAEYDGEGRLSAVNYPVTGKRYLYGFDSRGLPSTLTNTTDTVTLVSSVTYGVAGEMTALATGGGTETRGYNVNGQMTTLNLPGRSITYNFPAAGANNGKVASIVDSGETITYQYDALQRLISATGSSGWSQTFAPMTAGMPDAFNMTYGAANRMVYSENPTQSRTRITFTQDAASVWFGGKLVQKVNGLGSSYASEDRLGSAGKYLPYGEDKPGASGNPANDNEKFAATQAFYVVGGTINNPIPKFFLEIRWPPFALGFPQTTVPMNVISANGNAVLVNGLNTSKPCK